MAVVAVRARGIRTWEDLQEYARRMREIAPQGRLGSSHGEMQPGDAEVDATMPYPENIVPNPPATPPPAHLLEARCFGGNPNENKQHAQGRNASPPDRSRSSRAKQHRKEPRAPGTKNKSPPSQKRKTTEASYPEGGGGG